MRTPRLWRRRHAELGLLLRAGQEYEAGSAAPLDRLWSAAAQQGLVASPTPPTVEQPPAATTRHPRRPVARPHLVSRRWRQVALIVSIIALLTVAGSVVVWEHLNMGTDLIQNDIPAGGDH